LEGPPALRRLRDGRADRGRDRVPGGALAAGPRAPRGCPGGLSPVWAGAGASARVRGRRDPRLRLREALVLGALHGPAELLPISSSGHTELVPWLLGWEYADVEPELRKAFEGALHAGTAAALLVALRGEVGAAARGFDRRRATLVALSFLPPAV